MSKSEGYCKLGRSVVRERERGKNIVPESILTEISSGFGIGFKACRIQCIGDYDNRNFRLEILITHQRWNILI